MYCMLAYGTLVWSGCYGPGDGEGGERGGDVLCSIYSMNSSEHCVCSVNNNMLDFCGKHY